MLAPCLGEILLEAGDAAAEVVAGQAQLADLLLGLVTRLARDARRARRASEISASISATRSSAARAAS